MDFYKGDNLDKDNFFKNLRKFYKGDKFKLLKRKGVYPYDYTDSLERLDEEKLPSKDEFFTRDSITPRSVTRTTNTLRTSGESST